MSTTYHGPTPVTKSDVAMAKKHIKSTEKVIKKKITDHQKAMNSTNNPKSKAYNRSHLTSHKKEIAKYESSYRIVSKLHPKV